MPSWGNAADGHTLSEQDRWDLVDYVKTFSDRFQKEEVPPPIDIPYPPFPASQAAPSELVREGKLVYRVLQCWTCHGMGGKGDGPSANALVDDFEVPIRPFDFTTGNFKFGDSPAQAEDACDEASETASISPPPTDDANSACIIIRSRRRAT